MKLYRWLSGKTKGQAGNRKPAWRVREPQDRSDPVKHECFVQARTKRNALILGASIRGKSHAHHGNWREDAFHFDETEGFTVMAVADGLGSCGLSRVGAGIASRVSVRSLKECLLRDSPVREPGVSESEWGDFLGRCLKKSVSDAIRSVEAEARERGESAETLSSTLILLIHGLLPDSGHLTASLQVGDGIAALKDVAGDVRILGRPDHGEYAGQTVCLTSPGLREDIGNRVVISFSDGLRCVAAMTDGVADDYFPPEKGMRRFFEHTEKAILSHFLPLRALKKWIRYEKIGSYDDRTLLMLSFR